MREFPQLPVFATPRAREGFTILELLVVISIMALIASFSIPAANSIQKGSQLTQGAQMVGDQLGLARQIAITRNHPVEVRFYQYGDPLTPGEQATDPSTGKYRALQAFEVLESGSLNALGKVQRLAVSIIMDSGGTLSSLIAPPSSGSSPVITAAGSQTVLIPRVQRQYNSAAFRFLPDGSTNLPKMSGQQWFLTLHNLNDGDGLSSPPKNFATLQVNAANGHIKTYRP